MALIAESEGLLFVLSPRTASTAVASHLGKHLTCRWIPSEDVLDDQGRIVLQRKHSTVQQLLDHNLLTKVEAADLLKVSAVRNPYDSIVSLWVKKRYAYAEMAKDPNFFGHKLGGSFMQDFEYIQSHTFSEWVLEKFTASRGGRRGFLFRDYVKDCDVVLRYEQLQEDVGALGLRLGVNLPPVPVLNATEGKEEDYRNYYTKKARKAVAKHFKSELRAYGYEF